MFLTYSQQQSMVQDLAKDSTAGTLSTLQREINVASGMIFHELNRFIFEESTTQLTVAGQQGYQLPNRMIRMSTVTVTSGTIPYVIQEIANRDEWLRLNQVTNASSTYPTYYFVDSDQIYFFPKPAGDGNIITIIGEMRYKDMTTSDYTTGTITSIAQGDVTVTGFGTAWTNSMVGRYIRITSDGGWYKITSVPNATTLTLMKNYEGNTLYAATEAYAIGEQVLGKYEDLHLLPVWWALSQFHSTRRNLLLAPQFNNMWAEGFNTAKITYIKRTSSDVIPSPHSMPPRFPYGTGNQFPTVPWP